MAQGTGLRVLLLTKGLDIGGLERMVTSLAIGLHRRGHSVTVAVVNGQRSGLRSELDDAGVMVHVLGGNDRIGLRGAVGIAKLLRSDQFDLVHVHGPLPSIIARATPGSPPIVTTSHTPLAALRPVTRWAWRATRRRDAVSIAVGDAIAAPITGAVVIPHAPDRRAAATTAPARPLADAGPTCLIAVASHRPVKNYPLLFDAVRQAREQGAEMRLVAVGEGPELERNMALSTSLGLDGVVEFQAPRADVLDLVASADLLVVSSNQEGQPLVVAEALAVGTPVVATDVGRVSELIGPDVGRVVPVGDVRAMTTALVELAESASLRVSMSAAALRQSSNWTIDDVLDAHETSYRCCLPASRQF